MAIETTTSVDVQTLTPFKRFIMTLGTLPTSYLESMTYAELVMWFCNYLQNDVIPTVNNNAEAVQELQNLVNYIQQYELQEEVSNKLDEMAEDGTLQALINNALKLVTVFDTFTDLYENKNTLSDGMKIKTLGYYNINDGGSADYIVTSTEDEDIYQIVLSDDLYLNIITNDINIKQLGAIGDGSTHPLSEFFDSLAEAQKIYPDATILTDEVSYLALYTAINHFYKKVIIPAGDYYVNKPLVMPRAQVEIIGNTSISSILRYTGVDTNPFIKCDGYNTFTIKNLQIIALNEKINYGIALYNSPYFKIDNVILNKFTHGLHIGTDCYDSSVTNSRFQNCTYGVHAEDASDGNNISFYNCIMFYNDYGISLGQGRNQALYSCDIERNNTCGLSKLNSGDLEVDNCYFELNTTNDIVIEWGSQPVDSVLIKGCSFYHSSTQVYVPINYHGRENHTELTFINNNFVNAGSGGYAVMQKSNATTLKPIFINNVLTNFNLINMTNFKGIIINNGDIVEMQKSYGFINGTSGGTTTLTTNSYKNYRLSLTDGTHTIVLPPLTEETKYYQLEYKFLLMGGNWNSTQTGKFVFSVDTSQCTLLGAVDIDNTKVNKEFRAVYLGYISNRYYWQIVT